MRWRNVGLGLLLASAGCAETASSTQATGADAGPTDLGQLAFLPPTDQCAATALTVGPCRAGLVSVPTSISVTAIHQAVRANGDNTAIFWSEGQTYQTSTVKMQRVGSSGDWIDAEPIALLSVPRDAVSQVATAWDHNACEPVVIVGESPGVATLHLGGLHTPSVAHPLALPDATAGLVLDGRRGLRAVDDGWAFFLSSRDSLASLVEVIVSPQGDVRSTRTLTAHAPVPFGGLNPVELLDHSVVLPLSGDAMSGAWDYQLVDARGEFVGPIKSLGGGETLLVPPLAATPTGYLLGRDVGAGAVSLAAFDQAGMALSPARTFTLLAMQRARAMLSTHGRPFALAEGPASRITLQPFTALGPSDPPLTFETASGSPGWYQLVPTTLGGVLVYLTTSGLPGSALRVAILRLCD